MALRVLDAQARPPTLQDRHLLRRPALQANCLSAGSAAGWTRWRSPVRVGGKLHLELPRCWRRNSADAGSHRGSVHVEFAGSAASSHTARGHMHPCVSRRFQPVFALVTDAALAIWPVNLHPFVPSGHVDDRSNGSRFTCSSKASASRSRRTSR